jgi:hypothetical protein
MLLKVEPIRDAFVCISTESNALFLKTLSVPFRLDKALNDTAFSDSFIFERATLFRLFESMSAMITRATTMLLSGQHGNGPLISLIVAATAFC